MEITTELLFRFFDQNATSEEEAKIKIWLEESEEHCREFFQARKLFDGLLLRGEKGEEREMTFHYSRPYRRIAIAISTIAASVLLAVVFTFTYIKSVAKQERATVVVVPKGQRVDMFLSDGTEVWLNSKTRMEYPSSFKAYDERRIKIDGEAYFKVAKDKKHPFIVETNKGEVEALGTHFYVKAYSHEKSFETFLLEGKVHVRTSKDSVYLYPNEEAILENGVLILQRIENYDLFRWIEGLYCFKDQPLREIFKRLEIYYDVHIIIKQKHLPNPLITGKFRSIDGIDYALKVLMREVKFSYHRDEETNNIYIY